MNAFDSFKTARTCIRRFTPSDEAGLIELLCNRDVTDNLAFDENMKTAKGAKNLLELTISSYNTENPLLAFAIESYPDKQFLGVSGLNPLNEIEVEIFYALLPESWGKGLATEVLGGYVDYLFGNTSFGAIAAFITRNNDASKKVAEKNGFKNLGLVKNPNFEDEVFLYKKEKIM